MISLDHFIWWPVEGKGYLEYPVAATEGFSPRLYKNIFKEFVPIHLRSHEHNPDFKGYLLFNRPDREKFLFTTISWLQDTDEYGRTGQLHHSVIIDKRLLEDKKISLFDIDEAIKDYKKEIMEIKNDPPEPTFTIPPLEVPEKENDIPDYQNKLKNYIFKAPLESVATRFMENDRNRTILKCNRSEQSERKNIAFFILELLNFKCGIRPISITTEQPRPEYVELFDLIISTSIPKIKRKSEDWRYIDWNRDRPAYERLKGEEDTYRKIDRAFSSKKVKPKKRTSKKKKSVDSKGKNTSDTTDDNDKETEEDLQKITKNEKGSDDVLEPTYDLESMKEDSDN